MHRRQKARMLKTRTSNDCDPIAAKHLRWIHIKTLEVRQDKCPFCEIDKRGAIPFAMDERELAGAHERARNPQSSFLILWFPLALPLILRVLSVRSHQCSADASHLSELHKEQVRRKEKM